MANDNGPVGGRPKNDGDLWTDNKPQAHSVKHGEFTFTDGSGLRGKNAGEDGFGDNPPDSADRGWGDIAPTWLEGRGVQQNDTNSLGSIGAHCKSDSMFERYPSSTSDPDTTQGGSESPETVASDKLDGTEPNNNQDGTGSDAMFERYPSSQSDEDDDAGASKTGKNSAVYTGGN